MQTIERPTATNERLKVIFDDLVNSLRQLIIKHRITEPEYRAAIEFVSEMNQKQDMKFPSVAPYFWR